MTRRGAPGPGRPVAPTPSPETAAGGGDARLSRLALAVLAPAILLALALAALYAASDEIHQTFVPSRQGSVWDVLLDTAGAAFGLLCLWTIGRLRKRW